MIARATMKIVMSAIPNTAPMSDNNRDKDTQEIY